MKKEDRTKIVKKFSTLRQMVDMAVAEAGDSIAYKYRDGNDIASVTYSEFAKSTSYLGTALKSLGMDTKHINIIGENSYKWIQTYLTSLLSAGVCCPVDKELPVEDIDGIMTTTGCKAVIYGKTAEEKISSLL